MTRTGAMAARLMNLTVLAHDQKEKSFPPIRFHREEQATLGLGNHAAEVLGFSA